MGLAEIREWISDVSTWPVHLSFLACALISTAIVSATLLTDKARTVAYEPVIPRGRDYTCAGFVPKSSLVINDKYVWDVGNRTDRVPMRRFSRQNALRCARSPPWG